MPSGFSFTAQMQLTAPNLKSFTTSIQNQLNSINGTIKVNVPNINGINSQIQALQSSLNSASRINPVAGVSKTVKSVTKDLKDASTAAGQFGELVGSSIRKFTAFSLAAGSVLTLVNAFQEGTKAALEFQREMVRLEQVGGNLLNSVGGIAKEISRLSTTFGASSSELSKVAVTLRQAGLSADDTKLSLDALAKSTLAPTFSNITNTVEGAVAVIQQFGVQAKDLTGILGSVNAVSAAFAVESDDIVHAVRRSGGAFKAAGGNLNELISLFTSVRQTTRESAETIASGFNTIFARAQRSDTVEKLKDLGINLRYSAKEAELFGKTEGEFVGPYEAVRRLNTALKNVPPASAQYAAIVEELGGFRQVSKVIPLIQQFSKAEQALGVSLGGTNSLTQSSIIAQKGLLQQVSQLKEQFLDLFRVITEDKSFHTFANLLITAGKWAVYLAKALAPLAPLVATFAATRIGLVASNFARPGFVQGFSKGIRKNTPTGAAGLAKGGPVPGFGDKDETPIMATPGEFMIRKPAARSIGKKALDHMNRTGQIPHYAGGGEIRKNLNIKDRTGGKSLNRVIISPPGGKVAMLVTGTRTSVNSNQTPVLPVSNLGGAAAKVFNRDKAELVRSGALSQAEADNITNITVPIAIRSPQNEAGTKVRDKIKTHILNALDSLSSDFSATSAGISITKKDGQDILKNTVTNQGIGRIFEGFLKVVAAKTNGAKGNSSSVSENLDFNPIDGSGLTGLFGSDLKGLPGDVKLNDTVDARASVVSKALRQFGISKDIRLSALNLTNKLVNKKGETVKYKSEPNKGQDITGLDAYKKRFSKPSAKFATGGLVPGRGTKDDFPAHLQRGEFVMRQRAVDLIGPAKLDQMNRSPEKFAEGGIFKHHIRGARIVYLPNPADTPKPPSLSSFADRTQQTFSVRDAKGKQVAIPIDEAQGIAEGKIPASKYGLTSQLQGSVTKKQKELDKRQEGVNNGVLSVPFSGDSLGLIGFASLARHGLINKINPIPAELKGGAIGKLLKEKGITKLNTKYTTYGISNQATKDFRDEIAVPVTNSIANTFQGKFGGDPAQYKLSSSELGTVEGYLYEKYIRSISKTKFENKKGEDLTFDYPHGLGNDDNFSKVVIPHPVTAKYIDAKYNADDNKLGADLARKYFNHLGVDNTRAKLASIGFAEGGSSKKDTNALLMRGEYVIGADSAKKIGYDRLKRANKNPERFAGGGIFPSGINPIDKKSLFEKLKALNIHINPDVVKAVGIGDPASYDPSLQGASGVFHAQHQNVILQNPNDLPSAAHHLAQAHDFSSIDDPTKFSSQIPGSAENQIALSVQKHLAPHLYDPKDQAAFNDLPELYATGVQHLAHHQQSQANIAAGLPSGIDPGSEQFYGQKHIGELFNKITESLNPKAKSKSTGANLISDKLKEFGIEFPSDIISKIGKTFNPSDESSIPHAAEALAKAHDYSQSKEPGKYSSEISGTKEHKIAELSRHALFSGANISGPIAHATAFREYTKYKQAAQTHAKTGTHELDDDTVKYYNRPNVQSLFKHIGGSSGHLPEVEDAPEINFPEPEPVVPPTKVTPKAPTLNPNFPKGSGIKPFGVDLVTDKLRDLNTDIPVVGAVSKIGRGDPGKIDKKLKGFSGGFSPKDKSIVVNDENNLPLVAHELAHAHDYNVGGSDFSSNIPGSRANKVAQMAIKHLNPEIYSSIDKKAYSKLGINLDTDNPEAYAQTAQHHTLYNQAQANIAAGLPSGLTSEQEQFYQSKPIQGLFGAFRESIGAKPKEISPEPIKPYVPKYKPTPLASSTNAPSKLDTGALTSGTSVQGVRRSIGTVQTRQNIQDKKDLITKASEKPKAQKKDTCCDKIVKKLDEVIEAIKINGTGKGGSGNGETPSVTHPEEPTEPKNQKTKTTLGERLERYGPTAAIIASQFAPQLLESAFGTPETQKKDDKILGYNKASVGAALGGAISGAGLGASTGAILGPAGAGIGLIAGGAYGLYSSLKDAENKIRTIRIDKELDSLGKAIDKVTSEEGKISNSGIASIKKGFQAINEGARESGDPEAFLAEKVNVSQIQSVLTKAITSSDLTGKETADQRKEIIQGAAGGLGKDALNILAKLPENANKTFNELFKQFDELAIKVGLENERAKLLASFDNRIQLQTKNFDRLAQAISDAVNNLDHLDTALVTIGSAFEGSHQLQGTNRFSVGAAGIGTSNIKAFNDSVDLVTSAFDHVGLAISKDFNTALKDTNVVLKNLPSILGSLASEGSLSHDNLESRFRTATERIAPGVSKAVRENTSSAFGAISLEDINKNLKDNPQKIIDDITSKLNSTTQALDPAVKALENVINAFSGNLNKYQELSKKVEETQQRVVDAQIELATEQHRVISRRVGLKDTDVPVDLQQSSFNIRQQRLSGVSGQNSFDPRIIGARLAGINETIHGKTEELNTSTDKSQITKLQNELSNLGGTSNKLRGALEHLADSAARNAAINERLAKINEEEAGRLNIAEEYAAASPQDRQRLDLTATAANRVANTGNLEEFGPELRSAILEFSHKVENFRTPALNGLTGGEFRQRILQNNPISGVSERANLPANVQVERNTLENQKINNLATAAVAQEKLAESLDGLKNSFFTQLQSNQKQFLNNLEKNLLESEKSRLEQQKIAPQQEITRIKTQDEAAKSIVGLGVKYQQIPKAIKLSKNADLLSLSKNIQLQNILENINKPGPKDLTKLGSNITSKDIDLETQYNGHSFVKGTKSLQDLQDKLGESINDISQGNVTGATKNRIISKSINRFEDLPSSNRTSQNLQYLLQASFKEEIDKILKGVKEEGSTLISKTSGDSGLEPGQIVGIASNFESFNKYVEILGNDFESISTRYAKAYTELDKLTESIGNLNTKIASLSPVDRNAGGGTVLSEVPQATQSSADDILKKLGATFPVASLAKGGRVVEASRMLHGSDGKDTKLALVSPKETVINEKASSKHRNLLDRINAGKPIHMASGGLVRRQFDDEDYDYGTDLDDYSRADKLSQVPSIAPTAESRQSDLNDTDIFLSKRRRLTSSNINKGIDKLPNASIAIPSDIPALSQTKKVNGQNFLDLAKKAILSGNYDDARTLYRLSKKKGVPDTLDIPDGPNKLTEGQRKSQQILAKNIVAPVTGLDSVPPGPIPQGDASALVPRLVTGIDPDKILSKRRKQQITGLLGATEGRSQNSFTIPELRNAANVKLLLDKTRANNSKHGQAFANSTIKAALDEENNRRSSLNQPLITPNQRIPRGISKKAKRDRINIENNLNASIPFISVDKKDIGKLPRQFIGPPLPKPKRKKQRFTIDDLNEQFYRAYGFADGGVVAIPPGHDGYTVPGFGTGDHVHALLTPGERVVPVLQSREQGNVIDHIIKGGKAIKRFANGRVGEELAGNVGSGGNEAIGSVNLSKAAESIEKSSNNMMAAAQSFNVIIEPLNSFTQTAGQMISPLTQFNAAATNLGIGLTSFAGQVPALIEGMKALANIPSTITIGGSIAPIPINVNITQELTDLAKQQIVNQVISQLKSQFKSGDVL